MPEEDVLLAPSASTSSSSPSWVLHPFCPSATLRLSFSSPKVPSAYLLCRLLPGMLFTPCTPFACCAPPPPAPAPAPTPTAPYAPAPTLLSVLGTSAVAAPARPPPGGVVGAEAGSMDESDVEWPFVSPETVPLRWRTSGSECVCGADGLGSLAVSVMLGEYSEDP